MSAKPFRQKASKKNLYQSFQVGMDEKKQTEVQARRKNWKIDDTIQVYSTSRQDWCTATITDIIWVVNIKYFGKNKTKMEKEVEISTGNRQKKIYDEYDNEVYIKKIGWKKNTIQFEVGTSGLIYGTITNKQELLLTEYELGNGATNNKKVKRFGMRFARDKTEDPNYTRIRSVRQNDRQNAQRITKLEKRVTKVEKQIAQVIKKLAEQRLEFEQSINVREEKSIQNRLDKLYYENDENMIVFYEIFAEKMTMLFFNAASVKSKYVDHKIVYDNKILKCISKGTKLLSKLTEDIPFVTIALNAFNFVMDAGYDALVIQQAANCVHKFKAFGGAISIAYWMGQSLAKVIKETPYNELDDMVNDYFDYLQKLISTGYAKEIYQQLCFMSKENKIITSKNIMTIYWDVMYFMVLEQPSGVKSFDKAWNEFNVVGPLIQQHATDLKKVIKTICLNFESDTWIEKWKKK
eukprot:244648_1